MIEQYRVLRANNQQRIVDLLLLFNTCDNFVITGTSLILPDHKIQCEFPFGSIQTGSLMRLINSLAEDLVAQNLLIEQFISGNRHIDPNVFNGNGPLIVSSKPGG
jgi:hypothetical protein